jgi:biopolymer transport protein ExbB/TolQ
MRIHQAGNSNMPGVWPMNLQDPEQRKAFWNLPDRRTAGLLAIGCAVFLILSLTVILPKNSRTATLILDRTSPHFPYPFTIQNIEHVLMFIGLGELFVRWRVGAREMAFIKAHLLPEDDQTVLQVQDLGAIRRRVSKLFDQEHGFLPALIDLCILQFQSGRSIDQAVAVLDSSLELTEHRVDLRYGIIRYIAWLIPTMGFIGTVIGLGSSLASVPSTGDISLFDVAHKLALGFDCTMVALAESAIIVFLLQIVNEQEETSVNLAGTYTLRNLINRLYEGEPRMRAALTHLHQ